MVKNFDQLLDTSPRHLMSSLQQRMSPCDGEWKLGTNDLVVEIRRERREAIESGKLKGRRLFQAEDGEAEMGFGGREGTWCGWNGLVQESEVRSVSFDDSDGDDNDSGKSKETAVYFQGCNRTESSSSSSSSLADEKVMKREVKREEAVKLPSAEKKRVYNNNEGGNGGKCMVMIMLWLAIASPVFAICFIKGFAGDANENEVILVPT